MKTCVRLHGIRSCDHRQENSRAAQPSVCLRESIRCEEIRRVLELIFSMLPRAPRADAIHAAAPGLFPSHTFSPEPISVLSCRADDKTGEFNWLRSQDFFDWDWESDRCKYSVCRYIHMYTHKYNQIYIYVYIYICIYVYM